MSGRAFRLALCALLLVTALGSTLDVMEVDAAQYASMSRDMLDSDNWLLLHHRGQDYLDKPPLLFWLSALSFKLFGVHSWSYKLPSILFAFLCILATYRATLLHHGHDVARTAALMFGSSAAFVLMTNDVRTDTILTGSVMTAIWLGMAWMEQRRTLQLVGCAVAIAAAMLAKGPMGLMAPMLALGGHLLLSRKGHLLRDPRLLLVPLLVAILLLPMCMGLYEQHGTHGLRFYFWEQSFGRITGVNRWKDDSTVLFFAHELPWLVLPWTLAVLVGLRQGVRALVTRQALPEYASLSGAVLVFLALSSSQFKLPHYLYVVLPLFAILGARAWHSAGPFLLRAQAVVIALLWGLAMLLVGWSFTQGGVPFLAMLGAMAAVAVIMLRRTGLPKGLFPATFWTMVGIAVALNGQVYPKLLHYQANARVGKWAAQQGLDGTRFFGLQRSGTALDFYAGFHVPWLSNAEEAARVIGPGIVLWTDGVRLKELQDAGLHPQEIMPVKDYPVQLLGLEMLHPGLRPSVLEKCYLIRY